MSHKYLMKTHGIKVVVFWEGYKFEKKNLTLGLKIYILSNVKRKWEIFLNFFLAFSIKSSLN